jgi:hypothetical protein
MRFIKIGFLCGVLSLVAAVPAWAGHPQARKGLWFGVGGGFGSAQGTCDGCDRGERDAGTTGFLKVGGTLNKRVLLGFELNLWARQEDDVTLSLYNASATVTFYPRESSGFFVKGGLGSAFVDREVGTGSSKETLNLGSGLGLLAGAGYDLRVGRNISITPALNYYYGSPGDLQIDGQTRLANWKQNVVDVSIGVTFH